MLGWDAAIYEYVVIFLNVEMYVCIVVIIQKMRKKATLPNFLPFSMSIPIHKAQRRGIFFCFLGRYFSSPPLKENAESFGHAFKCRWVWFVVQRSKCALGHDLPSVPVLYHLCTQRGVLCKLYRPAIQRQFWITVYLGWIQILKEK